MRQEAVAGQPVCPDCAGRLYSTVVNFGDTLPVDDLEASYDHAEKSDLFIVLGSSLVVSPAADLPGLAQEGGAKLVLCNLGETPLDAQADLRLAANVGGVMEALLAAL